MRYLSIDRIGREQTATEDRGGNSLLKVFELNRVCLDVLRQIMTVTLRLPTV